MTSHSHISSRAFLGQKRVKESFLCGNDRKHALLQLPYNSQEKMFGLPTVINNGSKMCQAGFGGDDGTLSVCFVD